MSAFQPNEIVDVVIKGVRVAEESPVGLVTIVDEHGGHFAMPPQAAIERVAPAEWPPRPGDIWAGPQNERWFALKYYGDFDDPKDFKGCNSDGWRVVLMPMQIGPYGNSEKEPDDALRTRGPLTLVHREDEQADGEVSEP